MKDGFINPGSFLINVLTALIILQIWYYTTLFVNRYGENDKLMHAGIFVNMYLLYFMARGIRWDWQGEFYTFNGAWLLILLNIAAQYFVQLKKRMMLHVLLILSLNHVTAALEFMREEEVNELPKNIFLVASFALFYIMSFLIMRYNKREYQTHKTKWFLFLAAQGRCELQGIYRQ